LRELFLPHNELYESDMSVGLQYALHSCCVKRLFIAYWLDSFIHRLLQHTPVPGRVCLLAPRHRSRQRSVVTVSRTPTLSAIIR